MAGPGDPQVIVRTGTAEPGRMALSPGQAVGPLSIGRSGNWRVVAPGVLEEHAFLYFNGTELFLQSANPNSPVTVNGSAIPGSWTPVYAPCEIAFGGARLWFGTLDQQPRSMPPPPATPPPPAPEPSAIGKRPFTPRVQGLDEDDESTRLHPIEELQAARRPAPKDPPSATLKSPTTAPSFGTPPPSFGAPPPSVPAPAMGPGPVFGAPPPGPPAVFPAPGVAPDSPPGAVLPSPGAAPPPAKRESWIAARWREASGPKKAMAVLMLPLVWAVWVIFTDKPPAARPPKPATSAAASPSATPSAGVASASVAPAPPPTPAPPPPSPSGKASASPSTSPSSTAKTPQREAADAVAVGAYDKAAKLYEELAKEHPDVPAYGEAARIMKAKAGKR